MDEVFDVFVLMELEVLVFVTGADDEGPACPSSCLVTMALGAGAVRLMTAMPKVPGKLIAHPDGGPALGATSDVTP